MQRWVPLRSPADLDHAAATRTDFSIAKHACPCLITMRPAGEPLHCPGLRPSSSHPVSRLPEFPFQRAPASHLYQASRLRLVINAVKWRRDGALAN
jgi:hypothetical protein